MVLAERYFMTAVKLYRGEDDFVPPLFKPRMILMDLLWFRVGSVFLSLAVPE